LDFFGNDAGVKGRCSMPTYEFVCEKCKKTVTLTLKLSEYEKKNYRCPHCKSKKLTQQISGFQTITSKKS
jgi:putative FmdB family regulatory protein